MCPPLQDRMHTCPAHEPVNGACILLGQTRMLLATKALAVGRLPPKARPPQGDRVEVGEREREGKGQLGAWEDLAEQGRDQGLGPDTSGGRCGGRSSVGGLPPGEEGQGWGRTCGLTGRQVRGKKEGPKTIPWCPA